MQLPGWTDLQKSARSHLEWIAAIFGGATIVNWKNFIEERFYSGEWDMSAYMGAVFDWSSIQAALLFGIYAFFLARSEAFVVAIAGSPAFVELRHYVLRTLYLSIVLTVSSLPFLVSPPVLVEGRSGLSFVVFVALSVVLIFTFCSFLKVIRIFRKIDRRR